MPFPLPKTDFTQLDYVARLSFLDNWVVEHIKESPINVSSVGAGLVFSLLLYQRLAYCRRPINIYEMRKDCHILKVKGLLHGVQDLFAWDS